MRPLSLQIEGFTCYRERQPLLDLSNMSLFAIAGDTGAGKSTLLDAMLYALYGMVPRIGKHGIGELISHGRNVLSVTFDFSLQGRTYRLMRRATKSTRGVLASEAALEEVTPSGERSIAGTVTAVNQQIEQLLGLGFETFTQTVILPQNEFARFLQSPAKDRREILQHLLRHQIYEEMRRRAERRKDLLGRDLASKDEQLDRLKDATAAALEALKEQLNAAGAQVAQKEQDAKETAQYLAKLKVLRDLTIQLEACRQLRLAHDEQAPAVERMETELTAARASAAVFPRVEAVETARKGVAGCSRAQTTAENTLVEAEIEHKAAVEQRQAAKTVAAEVPSMREQLQRLAEITNDVNQRPLVGRELADSRVKRNRQANALKAETAALKQAEQAEAAASATVTAAQDSLLSLCYDPATLIALDALREDVTVAENLTSGIDKLQGRLNAGEADVAEKTAKVESLGLSRAGAAAAHERAQAALRSAAEAKAEGERRHAAASLQEHLHLGDVCPVCDRQVSDLPTRASLPELEALRGARDEAAAAEKICADTASTTDRAFHRAETALEHAHTQFTAIKDDLAERRTVLNERITRIADALGAAGGIVHGDVLVAFRAALKEMQSRADATASAAKDLADAQAALNSAKLKLQNAQSRVRLGEQALATCDENVRRLEEELAALEARIKAVTTSDDPITERDGLAKRIEHLESAVRDAETEVHRATVKMASAKERLTAALQAKQEADDALAAAQVALDEALHSNAFESADAVKRANRTTDIIRSLENSVREFRAARAANQARLAELEPKVIGREVEQSAVTEADRCAETAAKQFSDALSARARFEQSVLTMTQRVTDAQKVAKEREGVAASYAVTAEMSGDLRTDGFQTYLLEEAFKGLVTGASDRLFKVSRRYTMECNAKGEFYVLDHDNAGERRKAETLSGGETFMASLCLALQLSEEVLRSSGAIRMDGLFIDEGFGTLDADSLSEVTDVLEALREDGDRMIGIISHRAELTDRLPGCIVVQKGVGESRWVVEREG